MKRSSRSGRCGRPAGSPLRETSATSSSPCSSWSVTADRLAARNARRIRAAPFFSRALISRGAVMGVALSLAPIANVRSDVFGSKRSRWLTTSSSCRSALRSGSFSCRPRGVITMPLPEAAGVRSGSPNTSRSRASCADSAGWLMPSRSAARVTLRSSSRTLRDASKGRLWALISIEIMPHMPSIDFSYHTASLREARWLRRAEIVGPGRKRFEHEWPPRGRGLGHPCDRDLRTGLCAGLPVSGLGSGGAGAASRADDSGLLRCGRRALHRQRAQLGREDAPSHHPDRLLRRQLQEPPGAAALSSAEPSLPRASEGGRRRARGGRLCHVHASACRSLRLEHASRRRPLGADLPERALSVLEGGI